ncbi:MAG: hypothetical protein Ct9H300mP25_13520 [Acidobacteriota bacterium]|nr:MAG: hypothetical protein Ct9H300mP25_13520 [Acidobacteriota bacterium]
MTDQLGGALSATVHLVQNDVVVGERSPMLVACFVRFPYGWPLSRHCGTRRFQSMATRLFYVGASVQHMLNSCLGSVPWATCGCDGLGHGPTRITKWRAGVSYYIGGP